MTANRPLSKAERKQARRERIHGTWEENYDDLVSGEVTLAEILGHTDEKLMKVADLGLLMMQVGKYDPALKLLQGLPLLDPYVPYFHMLLALLHEKMSNPFAALGEYEQAVALCESMDPPAELLSHVLLNQCKLYARLGRMQDSLEAAQRLVSGELQLPDVKLRREAQLLFEVLSELGQTRSGGA